MTVAFVLCSVVVISYWQH